MRWSLLLLLAFLTTVRAAEPGWLGWFSHALRESVLRGQILRRELDALGSPVIGNTVTQLGYQHVQRPVPPPESPWVQVDLGASRAMDHVALVPALVDFQSMDRPAYGFPRRFRVDLSEDAAFESFQPILVQSEEDFPNPGHAPVVIATTGRTARYIRVTVNRLAEENGTFFFALAELIVLSGNRNLALGCPVSATNSVNIAPRWHQQFLVDGRTPLGPPIQPGVLPEFDALFAGPSPDGRPPWMGVDLGEAALVTEVRLHPLHARQGADVPGFRFPLRYKVEVASDQNFTNAALFYETGGTEQPNPGNNPVTVTGPAVRGRYVRIVSLKQANPEAIDFALSELQAYSGNTLLSAGRPVLSSGDPPRSRPQALLTDGFTSYGRLMEWPDWLGEWGRRTRIRQDLESLDAARPLFEGEARRHATWTGGLLAGGLLASTGLLVLHSRRRQKADLTRLRDQLARDLHDEIGSNLAGIAMISETASRETGATSEDWQEVQRIARESSDAMREVLWLVGARQEMGIELIPQLQLAAARILSGRTVRWATLPAALPAAWPVDHRRQVFLFFKESLTNIIKHARASEIDLAAGLDEGRFTLMIRDNGVGFDPATAPPGLGLANMKSRARQLGGTVAITTAPGEGTTIILSVPVPL